jgi:hypothetical protein
MLLAKRRPDGVGTCVAVSQRHVGIVACRDNGGQPEEDLMARYGMTTQQKVEKAMHERKRGTLRSGRSGKKVTSRKQAIAIGLSEARKAGGKVPRRRTTKSRRMTKKR